MSQQKGPLSHASLLIPVIKCSRGLVALALLSSGTIAVLDPLVRDRDVLIKLLRSGAHFGELAIFADDGSAHRRAASLQALSWIQLQVGQRAVGNLRLSPLSCLQCRHHCYSDGSVLNRTPLLEKVVTRYEWQAIEVLYPKEVAFCYERIKSHVATARCVVHRVPMGANRVL